MYCGTNFLLNRMRGIDKPSFNQAFTKLYITEFVGSVTIRGLEGLGKENIVKLFDFRKLVGVSALGLVAVLGMSETANAQTRNNQRHERRIDRQQERIQRQRAKLEQQRERLQNQWNNRNVYTNNNNNRNVYANNSNRYRVYRNGSYYNTDNRGAELLRQAVNAGYQQGYRAGQTDRNGRRNGSWDNSSVYRDGTYGYQSYVDRNQYQYYFQQGFQKGYHDGHNSRYQYGSNNGGTLNILGTILQQVLNIQQY